MHLPPDALNADPAAAGGRKLRVLLCGYGHLGLGLLQGLLECSDLCDVVGVFRWSARPDSANCWEPVEGVFEKLVRTAGLIDIRCKGVNSYEFTALLERLAPDVMLIGSWGEIIRRHLIEHPGLVLVNCHPSLLPAHRGANPYVSVLMRYEAQTGVTFHRVAAEIDAGSILLQQVVPLDPNDTGASVRDRCTATAYQMTREVLRRLHAHLLQGQPLEEHPQDEGKQSYFPPVKPEDGLFDWSQPPEALYRQFRALFPWIACYGFLTHDRTGRAKPIKTRKVMLYVPNFVQRPPQYPADSPPGTILGFNRGVLHVALAHPECILAVSGYQIEGWRGRLLPLWLGQILSPLFFRPGGRFVNP